ncbi:hypothetical protein M408DRAFT_206791 [Serendipita vermifera MAFF 305830]|uniref:Uncharacterized protein n=1 Tax=Serendipita vermifera MAFF 305830 TaxID=933852 RepID=A0A0C2X932_SERVB|nr:hypothetical protein M408DRAFT_206791 [Serendipita vermifera MAFF 305830]
MPCLPNLSTSSQPIGRHTQRSPRNTPKQARPALGSTRGNLNCFDNFCLGNAARLASSPVDYYSTRRTQSLS